MITVQLMELFKNFQNLINIQYFSSNYNFTDTGLINFGKSLENHPSLNSLSLNFGR